MASPMRTVPLAREHFIRPSVQGVVQGYTAFLYWALAAGLFALNPGCGAVPCVPFRGTTRCPPGAHNIRGK